jgi:phthalate 4,5-dioxygenase oxygenase subunit
MLTREENELLTRTGPGTAMGDLLRRYWIPAMLSSELPEPDSVPVRITLLSENLIAFRDTRGRVGLLGADCPHRGAPLFFGRNEECGIRCVYHGWKFDVDGRCVDMPNEPPESAFKERVWHKANPCIERSGVIWTYMGPPEKRPEPPALEWALLGPEHLYVSKRWQECNYAQAMEGGIDSSHVSFLHGDRRARGDTPSGRYMRDKAPRFELVDTDYGFMIGARRDAEEDSYYWRITPWLFPWYTVVPPYGERPLVGHAWVPIDDENCWVFSVTWHPTRALTEKEREEAEKGLTHHPQTIPGTFRPARNKSNDYLIDREAQRSGRSYTGIFGISEQDTAVQEGMGPIFDRTQERLGASDTAIIQMRRRLLRAAKDLQKGAEPPGLDPDAFRVRSVSMVLPRRGTAWPEAAAEAMGVEPGHFFASVP